MLVRMKRTAFEAMEDRALVWACIEPTISRIRGKDTDVKSGVFADLTEGQQWLMLFQIFYGHTRSPAEFYWFACDYLSNVGLWGRMKAALEGYGCSSLLQVFGEIEGALASRVERSLQPGAREVTVLDLDNDPELLSAVSRLYERYRAAAGEALSKIAWHIRRHPDDYLVLEDDRSSAITG